MTTSTRTMFHTLSSLIPTFQILIMEAEDAKELHQDYLDTHLKAQSQQSKGKGKNKVAQASGGGKRKKGGRSLDVGDAAAAAEAAPLPPLSLGTELLEEDEGLAQVVAIALMQVWREGKVWDGGCRRVPAAGCFCPLLAVPETWHPAHDVN